MTRSILAVLALFLTLTLAAGCSGESDSFTGDSGSSANDDGDKKRGKKKLGDQETAGDTEGNGDGGRDSDDDDDTTTTTTTTTTRDPGDDERDPDLSDETTAATTLRLKGAVRLAAAINFTFGPGKDLSYTEQVNGEPASEVELFAASFGQNEGLAFGKTFADKMGPESTGYFMALAGVGFTVAPRCFDALGNQDGALCECRDNDSARSMLQRAVPFLDWELSEYDSLVTTFREGCQNDYIPTVTTLVSSMAFAKS